VPAFQGLHWTDPLDVLVMATLIYAAVRWARRSEGALVALGVAILSFAYVLATVLGLRVTTWAFQGIAALFAVVVVVLFQEELRAAFEGVAAWALGRRHAVRPKLDTTHIVVQAMQDLARRRVGALVVLPGLQPLRRHMRGGVELDGCLSVPLLQSLFDPHSDGHDGAVIVENRRVTHFGVQMPLSRDTEKIAGLGLRHTAALGLTERTDALCVVVSEERGAISLARGGVISSVDGAQALGERIDGFYRDTLPLTRRSPLWQRLLQEDRRQKAASLGAAAALWAVLVWRVQPVDVLVRVPVRVENPPPHARVHAIEPAHVKARLRGPRHRLVWPETGASLVVDMSDARPGSNAYALDASDLRLPRDVVAAPFQMPIHVELSEPTVGAR
jgi:uncharacterized protein (TIGR00159 family)